MRLAYLAFMSGLFRPVPNNLNRLPCFQSSNSSFAYRRYVVSRSPGLRLSPGQTGRPRQSSPGLLFSGASRDAHWEKLKAFAKSESGATSIEYGLIAAGISIAIIAVVNGLGTSLNAKFKSISTQLK